MKQLIGSLYSMMRYPITCKGVNQFLVDYLDGTLEPRVRQRFEGHVAHCPDCAAYLEQYRETIALVKDEGELPAPPEALAETTLLFLRKHGVPAPPSNEADAAEA